MHPLSLHLQKVRAFVAREMNARIFRPYNWQVHARPEQLEPPGDWPVWLMMAGRGFGKTRAGAETVRSWVESGRYKRIALIGATLDEARSVMVEGESGLLSVLPPWERPIYNKTSGQLYFPKIGALITLYSARTPEKLRGAQFDAAWMDELAKFPKAREVWDQLHLGLRLGQNPKTLVTTTPRTIPLMQELLGRDDVIVTRGRTQDNAPNLAPKFLSLVQQRYGGTRLGLQELEGHLLASNQNALWTESMIQIKPKAESFVRLVVAVDPAVSLHEESAETGLIVAGLTEEGHAYVLEDLSGRLSPQEWGEKAVDAYHRHKADALIAEVNNGGDLVQRLIQSLDETVAYKSVRATRGKYTRAEPIAAFYTPGRVFHTSPFPELKAQMLTFTPGSSPSPDRLDALVWALSDLLLFKPPPKVAVLPRIWGV